MKKGDGAQFRPGLWRSQRSIEAKLGSVPLFQNMSFSANWIWRENVAVLVMTPAEEL
jgi:hypothetical protein